MQYLTFVLCFAIGVLRLIQWAQRKNTHRQLLLCADGQVEKKVMGEEHQTGAVEDEAEGAVWDKLRRMSAQRTLRGLKI